jgi:hypothetical protein
MQGSSRPDLEFLDAKAPCGHLQPKGSVAGVVAANVPTHRRERRR